MRLLNRSHYFIVFRNCFIFAAILWLFPFCSKQYADTSFPYIPVEDIPFELIHFQGNPEPGKDFCPVLSPELTGLDYDIHKWTRNNVSKLLKEPGQFAADLNIKSGGVWHPQECQAQYEVCYFYFLNKYN